MLTEAEIANIEAELPRLQQWSPDICVPVRARKLRNPTLVWLNERWFLERQIDVTDGATRDRLTQWLLDEYAYVIPSNDESSPDYTEMEKTFVADCYGGSGMAVHGGSGRAGISGCLQVKGIGRTPLVGAGIDWTHSHGCMWLEEALREAICSELCANEFPHGAVPILAVIDAGFRYRYLEDVWGERKEGTWGERRALAIRPVAMRPAHFERAVCFMPPGAEDDARRRDVRRVRDVVLHLEREAPASEAPVLAERLTHIFSCIAQQVAFGRAHRLFHGDYLTSNLTVHGELLDFGAFRALPNWCKALSTNHLAGGFGDELAVLAPAVRSLNFYAGKYKEDTQYKLSDADLLKRLKENIDGAFAQECLRLLHLDMVDDEQIKQEALAALTDYYKSQQRLLARYQHGYRRPQIRWLSDAFAECDETEAATAEFKALSRIVAAIRESRIDTEARKQLGEQACLTMARLLPPRPELYRESLVSTLYQLIDGRSAPHLVDPALIEATINGIISRNRRHWRSLPNDLAVFAQYSGSFSHLLYCLDPKTGERYLWLESIWLNDQVWMLNKWVPASTLAIQRQARQGPRWTGLFPAVSLHDEVSSPDRVLALPPDAIWYDTAAFEQLHTLFRNEAQTLL